MAWTGGCACAAIRYVAEAPPTWASYCHCGICRKLSGAPYMAWVEFSPASVRWAGGNIGEYHSSPGVLRRFCRTCGTSLTFEADGVMFIALGSLDKPEDISFGAHTYTAFRLPSITRTDALPQYPGPIGGKGGKPIP